ncbi:MFS domain-containing histidine kinase [Ornithinibacillus halotolerans]|uniref:histidine kinase n=1 Tax=Ornithinibacillus halotolerans TaxID=1274357 RepID=A0A916S1P7_9BACI|nr:MFS domain-containing histidine kinase [Ornithinibacillus halotolerans]GGA77174.1 two-component sensor histidine kinase [Ornithinibacillus halotolerans]
MGTKWKSSLVIMIICAILFTFGVSGIFLLADHGNYYAHKSYFHTSEFRYEEVQRFTNLIGTFEVNDLSIEEAKEKITVSDEEIEEHRYRYGDLAEQIESINHRYEGLIQEALDSDNQQAADVYKKERDTKIEDITMNFESDEHVEAKIIKEKEQIIDEYYKERESYRSLYEELKNSFQYYFKDNSSGKIYTNIESSNPSLNDINDREMYYTESLTIDNVQMIEYEIPNSEVVYEMVEGSYTTLEGKIGVPKSLPSYNVFVIHYDEYKKEQIVYWTVVGLNIIALFLSLIIFKKAKHSRAELIRWKKYYDKIPIDVRAILFAITLLYIPGMFFLFGFVVFEVTTVSLLEIVIAVFGFAIGLFLALLQLVYILATLKEWNKLKTQWEHSISYRLFKELKKIIVVLVDKLKVAFLDQTTGTQIILLFGAVFILGLTALIVSVHPIFFFVYLAILGGVGIPIALMIINKIGEFNRIVETTDELAKGNLSHNLQVKGYSVLSKLAQNINKLKSGVKESQTEQAKSERLKTELITNVSHDLRTPLTSIITYTELLKEQEGLTDEGSAYLEIIDRKSKRLKVLIDDLFEVSKMTSGTIELNKEKVDLVQLLQQALGEYDDLINDSTLQFRVTHDDPPLNALVDGQKLWRVFDNLIGNILKYSLDYSRVYINLTANDRNAIITFKNVSKYELNENTDELFERFKRGDTSRHTDGSGLGLAIAQSIVELHEGSLDIQTDGDLFKVTITLAIEE